MVTTCKCPPAKNDSLFPARYNRGMKDDAKSHRGLTVAACVAIAILVPVLYVLSYGPARWLFTTSFPLTTTGKIRKDVLSAQLADVPGQAASDRRVPAEALHS